jgi:16S rRNA (adenine1518-N6/adenine1519-N6)-dimethyltransferase
MLTRSQLKEVFEKYDFAPLKRLGENYLIDGNIKDKIMTAVSPSQDDVILEIGPGLGALTIDLAKTGAKVFAVEKDKKAFDILSDLTQNDYANLKIINGDILEFDLRSAVKKSHGNVKVVGNLPYYITTPIIEYILQNKELAVSAVIMVQKEVASRLLAKPGTKEYSSLSCFVQYHTRPEHVYTVKRTCFQPAPDVDSAILKLSILDKPSVQVKDEARFFKIVRGAFNQRRKSIINSLSREEVLNTSKDKLAEILKCAGIDSSARPETLSLADFAKIANFSL